MTGNGFCHQVACRLNASLGQWPYALLFTLLFGAVAIPNGFRILMAAAVILCIFALRGRWRQLNGRAVGSLAAMFVLVAVYWWWQRALAQPLFLNSFRSKIALLALFMLAFGQMQPLWCVRPVLVGGALMAPVALLEAGYQFFVLHTRAYGAEFFSIHFGDVTALYALILAGMGLVAAHGWREKTLAYGGALLFTLAAMLSGTRGAWLTALLWPVVLVVAGRRLWSARGMALVTCALVTVAIVNPFNVRGRVTSAAQEAMQYQGDAADDGSVGTRFQMWTLAARLFAEKPLPGWGLKGYLVQRDQAIQKGELAPVIQEFQHAHNQFLDEAAKSGLVGIGAMLLLHGVPLIYFARRLKRSVSAQMRALALAGLLVPLCFFVFGLTEAIFSWNNGPIAVYFFAIAVFAAAREPPTQPESNPSNLLR